MAFKFLLQTDEHEGFKVSTSADNDIHAKLVSELIDKLISKIEKIKVTIGYEKETDD